MENGKPPEKPDKPAELGEKGKQKERVSEKEKQKEKEETENEDMELLAPNSKRKTHPPGTVHSLDLYCIDCSKSGFSLMHIMSYITGNSKLKIMKKTLGEHISKPSTDGEEDPICRYSSLVKFSVNSETLVTPAEHSDEQVSKIQKALGLVQSEKGASVSEALEYAHQMVLWPWIEQMKHSGVPFNKLRVVLHLYTDSSEEPSPRNALGSRKSTISTPRAVIRRSLSSGSQEHPSESSLPAFSSSGVSTPTTPPPSPFGHHTHAASEFNQRKSSSMLMSASMPLGMPPVQDSPTTNPIMPSPSSPILVTQPSDEVLNLTGSSTSHRNGGGDNTPEIERSILDERRAGERSASLLEKTSEREFGSSTPRSDKVEQRGSTRGVRGLRVSTRLLSSSTSASTLSPRRHNSDKLFKPNQNLTIRFLYSMDSSFEKSIQLARNMKAHLFWLENEESFNKIWDGNSRVVYRYLGSEVKPVIRKFRAPELRANRHGTTQHEQIIKLLQMISPCFMNPDFLKTEGLFRVNGDVSRVNAISEMWEVGDVTLESLKKPHEITHTLKNTLRNWGALISSDLQVSFLQAHATRVLTNVVTVYHNQLNYEQKKSISLLLFILSQVASFSPVNKMGPSQLGNVFAEIIFPPSEGLVDIPPKAEMVAFMIKNVHLFYVN